MIGGNVRALSKKLDGLLVSWQQLDFKISKGRPLMLLNPLDLELSRGLARDIATREKHQLVIYELCMTIVVLGMSDEEDSSEIELFERCKALCKTFNPRNAVTSTPFMQKGQRGSFYA